MTNYEKIKSLTVKEMAKLNVKSFIYMRGYMAAVEFHTTDNSIFNTEDEALEYEEKWLLSEVDENIFDILLSNNNGD